MSAIDYDSFTIGAASMIKDAGAIVVWTKPAAPVDGQKPWDDDREEVPPTFEPYMVFFSVLDAARGGTRGFFESFMKGTEVSDASEVGFLAGNCGFTPNQADTIERPDGSIVQVVAIDKIAPAGPVVMYFVSVK